MSAVDIPPGLALASFAAGELRSRTSSRRLARRVLVLVSVAGMVTVAVAMRRHPIQVAGTLMMGTLFCGCVAALGYAIRSARLRIDGDGIRWGWRSVGFRMRPERMRELCMYRDALAVVPRRGSVWYVGRRDWEGFERIPGNLRAAGLAARHAPDQRAPLRARLQSYGLVLDCLLWLDAVTALGLMGIALFGA